MLKRMNGFLQGKNDIHGRSTHNETTLSVSNHIWHNITKALSYHLRNNLINDITKRNGTKLRDINRHIAFRDKS